MSVERSDQCALCSAAAAQCSASECNSVRQCRSATRPCGHPARVRVRRAGERAHGRARGPVGASARPASTACPLGPPRGGHPEGRATLAPGRAAAMGGRR